MTKTAAALATVAILLGLAAPVAADDSGAAYIRGTVHSLSGAPAYGVCATAGQYAVDVQPNGSYELSVVPGENFVYFYNCHDAAAYPYLDHWFWGGGQDRSAAITFDLVSGQVFIADVALPPAAGSPPEFGAVAGVFGSVTSDVEDVFLINDAGDIYSGTSDPLIPQPGHETATYIVAAPPGEYRLFAMGTNYPDTYLPVYYGTHPRGFAVSYEEGEPIEIPSGKYVTIDFDPISADSLNGASAPDRYNLAVAPNSQRPGIRLLTPTSRELDRVAVYPADPAGTALNDILLLAFPDFRSDAPSQVWVTVPTAMLGSYGSDTLPVWLDHHELAGCQSDQDDDCIVARSVDPDKYSFGEVLEIEVRTTSGGIFRVGDRPQFYDSVDSVFGGDILWLADSGITKGCNAVGDLFCPDDPVTRGQMAAFLVRGLGLTDRLNNPFTDDDSSIFQADIEKLAAAGVTRGCNPPVNDMFCPNDAVTRGQMAAFLVRALGYTDVGGRNLFVDDDGSVFEADIAKLAAAGVTKGCNPPVNDRFCPNDAVTRGQMAAFLHRALGAPR
jgi:hypothetical protein